jgi:hypothetical protein
LQAWPATGVRRLRTWTLLDAQIYTIYLLKEWIILGVGISFKAWHWKLLL